MRTLTRKTFRVKINGRILESPFAKADLPGNCLACQTIYPSKQLAEDGSFSTKSPFAPLRSFGGTAFAKAGLPDEALAKAGGPGRIRTAEGESQQIYSLPRLTTSVPTHKKTL